MNSEFQKMNTLKKKKTLKLDLNPVTMGGHNRVDSQTGLLNTISNNNNIDTETNNDKLPKEKINNFQR